jgi:colanic acid biosynthesis glycosyl transferase WcaI
MRILILNQAFWPDVVSTAQHAADLARALSERGHEVTVVASARGYDDPGVRFPRRESWHGVDVRRVTPLGMGKGARWRRAADIASFMFACSLRVLFLPRVDVVIAMTSPPLISWLARLLVPWKAKHLVVWAMDLNPDEAIAAGWLRENSVSARMLGAMLRNSLRRAESVVALDRFMKDRIVGKGVPAECVHVIPPWSHDDVVRFDRAGREAFRSRHGLQDKFVVMYSGNHSPCHPLDTLAAAAEKMANREDVVFCFVGGGSEHRKMRDFAAQRGLKNILVLPYQPLTGLAGSLSAADLHVVVMGDSFRGIVHPCKIYNICAVGVPVLYIGPEESHVTDLARELPPEYCHAATHGDVDEVVHHIKSQVERPSSPPSDLRSVVGRFSQTALAAKVVDEVERRGGPKREKDH